MSEPCQKPGLDVKKWIGMNVFVKKACPGGRWIAGWDI